MTTADRQWLRQAVDLARAGQGLASPNPVVGAVVVDGSGKPVGSGSYTYAGRQHAEVLALDEARGRAAGGTVYTSLEPCSIQGRTPPCVEALLQAGVRRVVVASRDRNPNVDGTGIQALREAGVEVEECDGELAAVARALNEDFFHFARTGRPLVTLKSASTLDGKIAAPDDNSGWITSKTARLHVQGVRHRHDAIMTGIGTVQADDCQLTDRTRLPRRRPLLRIVADSLLRLPVDSRIVESFNDDLLVATTSAASAKRRSMFAERGIPVQVFDSPTARVDLHGLMEWLGGQGVISVMVEGGAKLNWAILESGVADRVLIYYAPKILGGFDSLPLAGGAGRRSRSGALQLRNLRTFMVSGNEFAVEAEVVKDSPPA